MSLGLKGVKSWVHSSGFCVNVLLSYFHLCFRKKAVLRGVGQQSSRVLLTCLEGCNLQGGNKALGLRGQWLRRVAPVVILGLFTITEWTKQLGVRAQDLGTGKMRSQHISLYRF